MLNKQMAAVVAAGALVALAGAVSVAQAQMAPPPMQPPDHVDLYYNSPKADPGDNPANWSPRQNVSDSDRYEQLLKTNPAFRASRIRKECGSINEPNLYDQCVATFR